MTMLLDMSASLGARHLQPRVGLGPSFSHSRLNAGPMADPALSDQREQPLAVLRELQRIAGSGLNTARLKFCLLAKPIFFLVNASGGKSSGRKICERLSGRARSWLAYGEFRRFTILGLVRPRLLAHSKAAACANTCANQRLCSRGRTGGKGP